MQNNLGMYSDMQETKELLKEEFEVLTDGNNMWVSNETLSKVCNRFPRESIQGYHFEMDKNVEPGKIYFMVSKEFLNFIEYNTINPIYIPKYILLKSKENESINNLPEIQRIYVDDLLVEEQKTR